LFPITATSTASIAEAKRFMQKGKMVALQNETMAVLIQHFFININE
jgi:hypothetical protein